MLMKRGPQYVSWTPRNSSGLIYKLGGISYGLFHVETESEGESPTYAAYVIIVHMIHSLSDTSAL